MSIPLADRLRALRAAPIEEREEWALAEHEMLYAALPALLRLLDAALHLCGREADGTWVVYSDVHGDAIREHLLPVVRSIVEGATGDAA